MSKNNTYLLIGVVLVVVLAVGGVLFWVNSGKTPETQETPAEIESQSYQKIDASEIGLTLTPRADRRAVTLEITKLNELSSVEYELSYLAKGDIPRGVIGTIELQSKDKKISRELLLGTCSRNVCKYDEGVTSVTLVAKITKTDGKIYSVEETVDL